MWLLLWFGCGQDQKTVEKSSDQSTRPPVPAVNPQPPGQTKNMPGPPQNGQPPKSRNGFHPSPQVDLVGEASEAPLSIVIVSLDTVRADRMSIYGGRAEVSNIAQFAKESLVFEHAISHFPETALSHWALLSGVMPQIHGNVPANSGSVYSGPMIADIVKIQGYATGAFIGGVTLQDSACGLNRSFDVYDDQFHYSPEDMSRSGQEVTNRAVSWIRKQDGPFFAFVHYFDAHFPYTPNPPWDTRYDPNYEGSIDGSDAILRPYRDGEKIPSEEDLSHVLALYDGEISELDAKIAPLLNSVPRDAIVVITSDHGESFEHGYYFNHRGGLWEGITHVPLIIRAPNVSSMRIKEQVGLIDVLPTILELAGLRSDANVQGQSLVPLIDGSGVGREEVYSITDPWMPDPQFAVRTEKYKRIEGREVTVYDLLSDPDEQRPSIESDVLVDARQRYTTMIEPYDARQHTPPKQPSLSAEECARLEALGYTTCDNIPK